MTDGMVCARCSNSDITGVTDKRVESSPMWKCNVCNLQWPQGTDGMAYKRGMEWLQRAGQMSYGMT